MLLVHDAYRSSDLPSGGIAAIGNFDGLHRGQRAVLELVRARAAEVGLPSVVITFEPHPVAVLRPEAAPARLTTAERKEKLLEEAGVDVVLVVRFTPDFSQTPARVFVREFLHQRLALSEIYVGSTFVFGHRREGDLALLKEMGEAFGFASFGVEQVAWEGERISSTRIRRALAEGRAEDAAAMLGRPYGLDGIVVRGDRMGQRLGWPTINLRTEDQLVPLGGVYACRAFFPSFPASFECVTNIGTRPTVYENYQRVVESHILDFRSDVYGERVELAFHKRLREERLFPSVMDLSAQIGRDVEATRDFFAARRGAEELAEEHPPG
ncbi:MAG TPA: bifunctional riboflavin kinase/FAD synthetase [Thermoanaerobaculia bacterium]|nr:bifunctional riboflavin kinase/FAD synthetase [Thermoanaerobaculia bacterium]